MLSSVEQGIFFFAKQNGYQGTHDDYVRLNYKYYVEICKRNDANEINWFNWLQTQKVN